MCSTKNDLNNLGYEILTEVNKRCTALKEMLKLTASQAYNLSDISNIGLYDRSIIRLETAKLDTSDSSAYIDGYHSNIDGYPSNIDGYHSNIEGYHSTNTLPHRLIYCTTGDLKSSRITHNGDTSRCGNDSLNSVSIVDQIATSPLSQLVSTALRLPDGSIHCEIVDGSNEARGRPMEAYVGNITDFGYNHAQQKDTADHGKAMTAAITFCSGRSPLPCQPDIQKEIQQLMDSVKCTGTKSCSDKSYYPSGFKLQQALLVRLIPHEGVHCLSNGCRSMNLGGIGGQTKINNYQDQSYISLNTQNYEAVNCRKKNYSEDAYKNSSEDAYKDKKHYQFSRNPVVDRISSFATTKATDSFSSVVSQGHDPFTDVPNVSSFDKSRHYEECDSDYTNACLLPLQELPNCMQHNLMSSLPMIEEIRNSLGFNRFIFLAPSTGATFSVKILTELLNVTLTYNRFPPKCRYNLQNSLPQNTPLETSASPDIQSIKGFISHTINDEFPPSGVSQYGDQISCAAKSLSYYHRARHDFDTIDNNNHITSQPFIDHMSTAAAVTQRRILPIDIGCVNISNRFLSGYDNITYQQAPHNKLSNHSLGTSMSAVVIPPSSDKSFKQLPWGLRHGEENLMIYVSWLPRIARAASTQQKSLKQLKCKTILQEQLGIVGLKKVLLYPPSSAHCKFLFDSEQSASFFLSIYGGHEADPGPAYWKQDICNAFGINICGNGAVQNSKNPNLTACNNSHSSSMSKNKDNGGILATKVHIVWADGTKQSLPEFCERSDLKKAKY